MRLLRLCSRIVHRGLSLAALLPRLRGVSRYGDTPGLSADSRTAWMRFQADASPFLWDFLSTSRELFQVLNPDGTIRYISPSVEVVLGYCASEMEGLPSGDWLHPDDRQRAQKAFEHDIQHPGSLRRGVVVRVRHKDGSWRVLESVGAHAGSNPQDPVLIVHSIDITEQLRAEETLERSERLLAVSHSILEATLEATADGILVVDTEGKVVRYNSRFLEILNLEAEDALPGNEARMIEKAAQSLRDPQAFRDGIQAVYAAPEKERWDVLRAVDGRTIERSFRPLWVGGALVGRVWTFRDVTLREQAISHLREVNARLEIRVEERTQALTESVTALERELEARIQAERRLAQSEERYRLLVEGNSDVFFFAHGMDLRYQYLSPSVMRVLGWSPEDLVGQRLDVVHTDHPENARIPAHLLQVRGGGSVTYRVHVQHRQGELRVLEVIKGPVFAGEQVVGMQGFARDITPVYQAEVKEREARDRLSLALDVAQTATWDWDLVTQDIHYSENIADVVRTRGAVPTTGDQFIRSVHPEDQDRVYRAIGAFLDSGESQVVEYRVIVPGGGIRWLRSKGRAIPGPHGAPVRILGVTTNVTERKLAESRSQELAEARVARDAARQAEYQAKFLSEASALLSSSLDFSTTLQGVASLAVPELADWCCLDLIHEGRVERLAISHSCREPSLDVEQWKRSVVLPPEPMRHGVARVLRSGVPELIDQLTNPHLAKRDGFASWDAEFTKQIGAGSRITVPLMARGKVLGCLSLFSAESQRRYGLVELNLAEELARRAALAVENALLHRNALVASQAKSDFLAVMSHELRTPLTAVIGYAELLECEVAGPISEKQAEMLSRIDASAHHLLYLIEQLLEFSRIEAGHEDLCLSSEDVCEVIRESAQMLVPLAEQKGIAYVVDLPEVPVVAWTDPLKMRQIVLNLVGNAIKFTSQGEVRTCLRLEGSEIVFCVQDTGIGIAPENQSKVFTAFWQVEQSLTRTTGGTGLGLSVVSRIVEMMGGTVCLESALGQGSTFTVRLPLCAANPALSSVA